jgi:hypothetical protein
VELLVIGIVAAVVGFVWYFSDEQVLLRQLRTTKRTKIGELDEGQSGRVVGTARRLDKLVTAPFSGRPCLAYKATVQEKSSGKNATWRTIITETDGVRFFLEDASGRALVDPTMAKTSIVVDSQSSSGTLDDPTQVELAFLQRHGKDPTSFFGFNRALRYAEAVIMEGELVAIFGSGVREPDPDAPPSNAFPGPSDAYRGDQPTRLRLTSSAKHPLLISDAPETTKE